MQIALYPALTEFAYFSSSCVENNLERCLHIRLIQHTLSHATRCFTRKDVDHDSKFTSSIINMSVTQVLINMFTVRWMETISAYSKRFQLPPMGRYFQFLRSVIWFTFRSKQDIARNLFNDHNKAIYFRKPPTNARNRNESITISHSSSTRNKDPLLMPPLPIPPNLPVLEDRWLYRSTSFRHIQLGSVGETNIRVSSFHLTALIISISIKSSTFNSVACGMELAVVSFA